MKKALALAAALTLALTLPTAAFAADQTLDKDKTSGTADVTLNVMPSYSVTIPETIELKDEDDDGVYTATATVSASDVRLVEGYKVQVSMDSDFTMTDSSNQSKWDYQVTVGDSTNPLDKDTAFATFTTPTGTDTEPKSVTLNFSAKNPTYAGNYQETVTFKLAYVQA